MSIPFNAWSYTRDAIRFGVAIESDTRAKGRCYEDHSLAMDLRAQALAEELDAHIATLTRERDEARRECEELRAKACVNGCRVQEAVEKFYGDSNADN